MKRNAAIPVQEMMCFAVEVSGPLSIGIDPPNDPRMSLEYRLKTDGSLNCRACSCSQWPDRVDTNRLAIPSKASSRSEPEVNAPLSGQKRSPYRPLLLPDRRVAVESPPESDHRWKVGPGIERHHPGISIDPPRVRTVHRCLPHGHTHGNVEQIARMQGDFGKRSGRTAPSTAWLGTGREMVRKIRHFFVPCNCITKTFDIKMRLKTLCGGG